MEKKANGDDPPTDDGDDETPAKKTKGSTKTTKVNKTK